jgi:hypothetical protein
MRKLIVSAILFALVLSACAGGQPGSLESRKIAELETRLLALESQLAALSAAPPAEPHTKHVPGDAFGVAVAQYVIDTAGFHAMDEALNATQTVDPGYLSTVNRVRKVVAQAPWPEELHEQSTGLVALLDEFAAALDADDGAEAAVLAAELHTVQHDFSHAIDNWLGGTEGDHGHGG